MENIFWFLYCHFLRPRQSQSKKAIYVLQTKILANSTDVIILAYNCRPDSHILKKQASRYELQTKISVKDNVNQDMKKGGKI